MAEVWFSFFHFWFVVNCVASLLVWLKLVIYVIWQEAHKVTLNVYDLSQGLARQLSQSLLGKVIEGVWWVKSLSHVRIWSVVLYMPNLFWTFVLCSSIHRVWYYCFSCWTWLQLTKCKRYWLDWLVYVNVSKLLLLISTECGFPWEIWINLLIV